VNELPNAPSCERNRDPILAVLQRFFDETHEVLEIGSGTGQHAVYFAAAMPWLRWQCSDRAENLPGVRLWLEHASLANTPAPVELDVASGPWPRSHAADGRFDAAFSANTLHIMGWPQVDAFFAGLDGALADEATLVVYGPFNLEGRFTSESNAAFDASLRAKAPHQGLRDAGAVDALARAGGFTLVENRPMPANNRCLVWRRG